MTSACVDESEESEIEMSDQDIEDNEVVDEATDSSVEDMPD